jgi:hypothetical protein
MGRNLDICKRCKMVDDDNKLVSIELNDSDESRDDNSDESRDDKLDELSSDLSSLDENCCEYIHFDKSDCDFSKMYNIRSKSKNVERAKYIIYERLRGKRMSRRLFESTSLFNKFFKYLDNLIYKGDESKLPWIIKYMD